MANTNLNATPWSSTPVGNSRYNQYYKVALGSIADGDTVTVTQAHSVPVHPLFGTPPTIEAFCVRTDANNLAAVTPPNPPRVVASTSHCKLVFDDTWDNCTALIKISAVPGAAHHSMTR